MKLTKILLALNLFTLQSYILRFQVWQYPSNAQEVLIALLTATFATEIILNKKIKQTIKNILNKKVILFFLAITTISVAVNIKPTEITQNIDLIRHLKFLSFAIIYTFIFTETLTTEKEISKTLKWGIYGVLAFSLFSLIYNLLGFNAALDNRLRGPLDSAVYLAYYISPFLIAQIHKTIKTKSKLNIWLSLFLIASLLATKSMGAIAAVFGITILMLIKSLNTKLIQKRSIKLAIIIIGVIIIGFIIHMKIIPTLTTNYSSLDERGQIWKTAAYTLKEEPRILLTGAGPSQFEQKYKQYADTALGHKPLDYNVIQPHNIFILTIFNYGFIGIAILLYIIAVIVIEIFRTKILNIKDSKKIATFILIYFLIHGLIDTPIYKNDILIILILFLSLKFDTDSQVQKLTNTKNATK